MPSSFDKSPAPETFSGPSLPDSSNTPSVHGSLHSFDLRGPAGRLEALLNQGRPDAPYVTLLCHPHPLGGGTMHNKVVYHAMKVFHGLGWPVLRFNFRGTGLSEGKHDGKAESEDVRVALDWLSEEYRKPIVAAGFSFGAAMGLKACCVSYDTHWEIQGFAALGLPIHSEGRDYSYPHLSGCGLPKLFLSGDRDQFALAEQLRSIVATAAGPNQLRLIQGADHFFTGHLPAMQSSLAHWLRDTFPASNQPIRALEQFENPQFRKPAR
jgi:alpha/beta superfamily hydrolase